MSCVKIIVWSIAVHELSLKNYWRRGRRPNLVIFVDWSALIAGGWVVMAWSKNSN